MRFEFTVLGANSATPVPGRFPSAFVLNHDESLFLIDCGEGAQIKMTEFGIRRSKIDYIFISHLHGDHIFGLPGFINSLNLNRRTRTLTLIGPQGLRRFIEVIIETTGAQLYFPLEFIELPDRGYRKILSLPGLSIYAFPLKHRVPTFAYKFVEKKRPPKIDPAAIHKWSMTIEEIKMIKEGEPVSREGAIVPLDRCILPQPRRRQFAYCSDTLFDRSIIAHLRGVDVLYHEATYLHDMADKARVRMHSTAFEAAEIAREAEVGQLIIGHYSTRYKDLQPLLEESRSVFPNTDLALEGLSFPILHSDKEAE